MLIWTGPILWQTWAIIFQMHIFVTGKTRAKKKNGQKKKRNTCCSKNLAIVLVLADWWELFSWMVTRLCDDLAVNPCEILWGPRGMEAVLCCQFVSNHDGQRLYVWRIYRQWVLCWCVCGWNLWDWKIFLFRAAKLRIWTKSLQSSLFPQPEFLNSGINLDWTGSI